MSRIDTKYGVCSIGNMGYYKVTSTKEGNQGKSLHCLIWEDHYGKPIPEGYNIHHINGNKLDKSPMCGTQNSFQFPFKR